MAWSTHGSWSGGLTGFLRSGGPSGEVNFATAGVLRLQSNKFLVHNLHVKKLCLLSCCTSIYCFTLLLRLGRKFSPSTKQTHTSAEDQYAFQLVGKELDY